MNRPLKILISAYACEPGKGSEPGVGWNNVEQAARFYHVWVMTRSNNRALIEEALAAQPMPNVHWIYLDLPHWASFWKKGQRGIHLYYSLWQILAYRKARRLHHDVGFDLAHHVTFVNYWLPIFLPLLPIPFVWGLITCNCSAMAVSRSRARRAMSGTSPAHRRGGCGFKITICDVESRGAIAALSRRPYNNGCRWPILQDVGFDC